jgi:hypothetical protein
MLVMLSVLTGKFPPPVKEYYGQLKTLRSNLKQGLSPDSLQQSMRKSASLDEIDFDQASGAAVGAEPTDEVSRLRIQVRQLKAESEQLRAQLNRMQNDLNDRTALRH